MAQEWLDDVFRMAKKVTHLLFLSPASPLMIMVQKITLVAYALHDGKCMHACAVYARCSLTPSTPPGKARQDSQLNKDQREQKLSSAPGPIKYFSYMFNFHSLLAGHSCTMKEYLAFMDGSNFRYTDPSVSFVTVSLAPRHFLLLP